MPGSSKFSYIPRATVHQSNTSHIDYPLPMNLTPNHPTLPSRDWLKQHCPSHVARAISDSEGYEVSVEVTLIPPNHLEPVQRLGAQPKITSTLEPEGRAFKGAYSFIYFPVPHGSAMHTAPLATSKHDAKFFTVISSLIKAVGLLTWNAISNTIDIASSSYPDLKVLIVLCHRVSTTFNILCKGETYRIHGVGLYLR